MNKKEHDISSDLSSLKTASEVLAEMFPNNKQVSLQMIELMILKLQKLKEMAKDTENLAQ